MNSDRYIEDRLDPTQPWNSVMAPASGTLIQCDLSPRNGRKRSIALEIEKGSRCYRLRVRDYSRDKPIVTKSLGIKCPDDIFTEKDALHHLKEHPEAWLYFEGIKEQMEEGIWPKGIAPESCVFRPHFCFASVPAWITGRHVALVSAGRQRYWVRKSEDAAGINCPSDSDAEDEASRSIRPIWMFRI